MDMQVASRIRGTVKQVVKHLVEKKYVELEKLTKGIRLNGEQIKEGIEEYGQELILPPDSAFNHLDAVEVENVSPAQFSVRFNLYTVGESPSDLTLEMTLIDDRPIESDMRVEIDNILVL